MNTDTFEVRTVFDSLRKGTQSPIYDLLPGRDAHLDAVVTIVSGIPRRHYTAHVQLRREYGLSSGVVAVSDKKMYPWQAEALHRASHPYLLLLENSGAAFSYVGRVALVAPVCPHYKETTE